jgi:hypothetical protein
MKRQKKKKTQNKVKFLQEAVIVNVCKIVTRSRKFGKGNLWSWDPDDRPGRSC